MYGILQARILECINRFAGQLWASLTPMQISVHPFIKQGDTEDKMQRQRGKYAHESNTLCETVPTVCLGPVPWLACSMVLLCTFCNNLAVSMGNFLSVSHGPMTAFGGLGFRRLREKQQELMSALLHKGMHTRIDLRTTAAVISALRLGEDSRSDSHLPIPNLRMPQCREPWAGVTL